MPNSVMDHQGAHAHKHGPNCGHVALRHAGHVDYLHDGHLHHMEGSRVEEHRLDVNSDLPDQCTPDVKCAHQHGPNCGHEMVPHGDHFDYLVAGHLHHPHDNHCDDHGAIRMV